MIEEPHRGAPDTETKRISDDDPDMTIPIHHSGAAAKPPVSVSAAKPEKKSSDTRTRQLPSHDFSSALQTSSRVLTLLMGKKLRSVDEEIKSAGRDDGNDEPQWDGSGETFGNIVDLYEKREEFASGGQGVLSFAYDRALHRTVALKSLRKEHLSKKDAREDFIREARITASLAHPAVAPVYQLSGDEENGLHLAMKVLRGISLKKYLEQVCIRYQNEGVAKFNEAESLHHRIDIFLQICDAMEYVHNKQVIHGDLKPENIMIGEYHECYIMDWGIARPVPGKNQETNTRIVGTPRYIAPELLSGGKDGIQTDIYSLGVILFELVTLRAAFSGENSSEVLANVKNGASNPLRHRFQSRIPRDLAAVIRKAMAMNPAQRYQTVGELSSDLRRFLRGEEVSAKPDGSVGKVVRWANRHSEMLLLLMLVLVLASIAFATIGIMETQKKETEKERLAVDAEQYAYAKTRQNVIAMQVVLNRVSGELSKLNSDAALLMSLPPIPGAAVSPDFCPVDEIRTICWEKGNCFSPDLNSPPFFTRSSPLYFGGVSYLLPPGADKERAKEDLARLSPLIPRLKRTLLDSAIESPLHDSDEERIEEYKKGNLPVLHAYLSLKKNGLHLSYPGKTDYTKGYDPRKRPWYLNALGKGSEPVWSAPYHGTGEKRALMITASLELLDGEKRSYGVAGVDVPLEIFTRFLTDNSRAGVYTIYRVLVDENGRIVLRADGNEQSVTMHLFEEDENGVPRLEKFPDAKLLTAMRNKAYGSVKIREKGKTFFYVYSSIPALGWIYVEKLNWEKLLKYPHLSY